MYMVRACVGQYWHASAWAFGGSAKRIKYSICFELLWYSITLLHILLFERMKFNRLMRFLHSLRTFVYSIMATMKSLVWALVLLLLIFYVFGLFLTQTVSDFRMRYDPESGSRMTYPSELRTFWGSLPRSMFTLFKSVCRQTNDSIDLLATLLAFAGVASVTVFLLTFAMQVRRFRNRAAGSLKMKATRTKNKKG